MPWNKSITLKLILVFTLSSALIFTVLIGYNYYRSSLLLEKGLEGEARNLAFSLVHRVETELAAIGKVTEGLARTLEVAEYSESELLALMRGTLVNNPEIYGTVIAFEPYAFKKSLRFYDPYFYRENGEIRFIESDQSYNYLLKDWYQIARETEKADWSEPYFDDGGEEALMATYTVPFYMGEGAARRVGGIVASDVDIRYLIELVSSVKVLKSGYAAIISRNGMIIAHPQQDLILNENIFSIAEEYNDQELRELGRKMIRGESDFTLYANMPGGRSWVYYAPLGSTGWTLAVTFPEAELFAELNQMSLAMSGMGLAGVMLLTIAVVIMARSITRPLCHLVKATNALAKGNFDLELPTVNSDDEVGVLTRDFQEMKVSLLQYIHDLTETTAAKERIQSELKVATDIQTSLLPRIFPPFPDRVEFSIHASMDPAKEVGGDFFDFFFIDQHRLCFLIADVSDKGVPAALYMMVAKTLLKTEAQRLGTPAEILTRVNEILAADNESCMFVTVFFAILDTRNGEAPPATTRRSWPAKARVSST